jgi:hypothetical protein
LRFRDADWLAEPSCGTMPSRCEIWRLFRALGKAMLDFSDIALA